MKKNMSVLVMVTAILLAGGSVLAMEKKNWWEEDEKTEFDGFNTDDTQELYENGGGFQPRGLNEFLEKLKKDEKRRKEKGYDEEDNTRFYLSQEVEKKKKKDSKKRNLRKLDTGQFCQYLNAGAPKGKNFDHKNLARIIREHAREQKLKEKKPEPVVRQEVGGESLSMQQIINYYIELRQLIDLQSKTIEEHEKKLNFFWKWLQKIYKSNKKLQQEVKELKRCLVGEEEDPPALIQEKPSFNPKGTF